MKVQKLASLVVFACAVLVTRHADAAAAATSIAATQNGPLAPVQRGQMARAYVLKWGAYVQQVYGIPVRVWADRMVPTFVHADADNFRESLRRNTFEGAMLALSGRGHRMTDDQVVDQLAKAPAASRGSGITPTLLGSLTSDLVYTPLQPCRIFDTRSAAAGPIAANSSRNFYAIELTSFADQGGSATDCGTLGLKATAVAINLTAVYPSAAGYATAYPYGSSQPLAASVNYAAGAIVNNSLIVQIPNPLASSDFTIYSYAQSDYVADIVGYFAPPQATALECVNTATVTGSVSNNGGAATVSVPDCPAGYAKTTVYCSGGSLTNVVLHAVSPTSCTVKNTLNNVSGTSSFSAYGHCCRVPGR